MSTIPSATGPRCCSQRGRAEGIAPPSAVHRRRAERSRHPGGDSGSGSPAACAGRSSAPVARFSACQSCSMGAARGGGGGARLRSLCQAASGSEEISPRRCAESGLLMRPARMVTAAPMMRKPMPTPVARSHGPMVPQAHPADECRDRDGAPSDPPAGARPARRRQSRFAASPLGGRPRPLYHVFRRWPAAVRGISGDRGRGTSRRVKGPAADRGVVDGRRVPRAQPGDPQGPVERSGAGLPAGRGQWPPPGERAPPCRAASPPVPWALALRSRGIGRHRRHGPHAMTTERSRCAAVGQNLTVDLKLLCDRVEEAVRVFGEPASRGCWRAEEVV